MVMMMMIDDDDDAVKYLHHRRSGACGMFRVHYRQSVHQDNSRPPLLAQCRRQSRPAGAGRHWYCSTSTWCWRHTSLSSHRRLHPGTRQCRPSTV